MRIPLQLNANVEKFDILKLASRIETRKLNITQIINNLEERPWTKLPYKKENWGNRLHSVAPYIGRIKPAFAHWLIKITSRPGDVVLDPFCGIGTVPLEASLLDRRAIGFDLNDYAIAITSAKFDRRPMENNLNWLSKVNLEKEKIRIGSVSDYVRQFYHPKTLKEILSLREILIRSKREFLLGCLLGICHGHRPQYLSAWTGYIIPFKPQTEPEYRPVIQRMIAKATRMYETGFPLTSNAIIAKHDARIMNLPDNSVDVVISSPPYFDTIDYVTSNRLRLAILGVEEDDSSNLKRALIQKRAAILRANENRWF